MQRRVELLRRSRNGHRIPHTRGIPGQQTDDLNGGTARSRTIWIGRTPSGRFASVSNPPSTTWSAGSNPAPGTQTLAAEPMSDRIWATVSSADAETAVQSALVVPGSSGHATTRRGTPGRCSRCSSTSRFVWSSPGSRRTMMASASSASGQRPPSRTGQPPRWRSFGPEHTAVTHPAAAAASSPDHRPPLVATSTLRPSAPVGHEGRSPAVPIVRRTTLRACSR